MTLLLAFSAFAEPSSTGLDAAETCAPRSVSHLAPADGATDVPLDARLAVLLSGDGCGEPPGTLRLEDDLGLVLEVFDHELQPVRGGALIEIWPDGGLEPDTDYVLTYEGSSVHTSAFSTGSAELGTEVEPPAALEVEVADAFWEGETLIVDLDATASATPGAMAWFAERLGAEPWIVVVDADGAASASVRLWPASNATELCVVAAQQDAAGALSDWVEACTDFEAPEKPEEPRADERGCATVPGPSGLLLGLLALPLVRRRR